ncbi:MAG: hypothetical protein FD155_3393 [Bacteroidetes bacterium]|nr:MAG: hypothetical protein FD155_3393 [Bacteroidota bacterium]
MKCENRIEEKMQLSGIALFLCVGQFKGKNVFYSPNKSTNLLVVKTFDGPVLYVLGFVQFEVLPDFIGRVVPTT